MYRYIDIDIYIYCRHLQSWRNYQYSSQMRLEKQTSTPGTSCLILFEEYVGSSRPTHVLWDGACGLSFSFKERQRVCAFADFITKAALSPQLFNWDLSCWCCRGLNPRPQFPHDSLVFNQPAVIAWDTEHPLCTCHSNSNNEPIYTQGHQHRTEQTEPIMDTK